MKFVYFTMQYNYEDNRKDYLTIIFVCNIGTNKNKLIHIKWLSVKIVPLIVIDSLKQKQQQSIFTTFTLFASQADHRTHIIGCHAGKAAIFIPWVFFCHNNLLKKPAHSALCQTNISFVSLSGALSREIDWYYMESYHIEF